jgi:hypothetical protein
LRLDLTVMFRLTCYSARLSVIGCRLMLKRATASQQHYSRQQNAVRFGERLAPSIPARSKSGETISQRHRRLIPVSGHALRRILTGVNGSRLSQRRLIFSPCSGRLWMHLETLFCPGSNTATMKCIQKRPALVEPSSVLLVMLKANTYSGKRAQNILTGVIAIRLQRRGMPC